MCLLPEAPPFTSHLCPPPAFLARHCDAALTLMAIHGATHGFNLDRFFDCPVQRHRRSALGLWPLAGAPRQARSLIGVPACKPCMGWWALSAPRCSFIY